MKGKKHLTWAVLAAVAEIHFITKGGFIHE